jgi:superfamily II DNA or RNA helicase
MITELDEFALFASKPKAVTIEDFALFDDVSQPVKAPANLGLFGLRPYQIASVESVIEGFSDPEIRAQLVVLATGCGKTIVFCALADLYVKQGKRVLILAHTDELIDQAIDKMERSRGLKAAKEKANGYARRSDKVVVGSVQTLQRTRLLSWNKNHFDLIIVDEAHRSLAESYQNVLKHFTAKVLGVTATADRGDKKALGDFYQRVAYEYGLLNAVRDGWLVRPMVKTMPVKIDISGVKSTRSSEGSDLDRAEVSKRLAPFLDAIASAIRTEAATKRIILFLPSVETAQLMSAAMNKVGITCDYVSGECQDRTEKIAKYKLGEIQALCNMALLTEGFDYDAIDTLVVLRPTKIRSLYAQMIGRGTRPLNEITKALADAPHALARLAIIKASRKPVVTILDFLWLYERHDLIKPASLISPDPRVADQMGDVQGDLIEEVARAERDLLKKLAAEIRKNANKKSRVIDPLTVASELGDLELADYEPETARDAAPASPQQLQLLQNNGINPKAVKCRGHAHLLIGRVLARHSKGLATVRQLHFLNKLGDERLKGLGVDPDAVASLSAARARKLIDFQMQRWSQRVAETKNALH